MNYLVNLNLNKNELQNAVLQPLATAPASPKEGQIYYDSTSGDKQPYYYNGTSWLPFGAQASNTTPVMNGTAAVGVEQAYARGDHVHPTDTSRVATTTTVNGHALSSNVTVTKADVGLGNVTDGAEINQNAFSTVYVRINPQQAAPLEASSKTDSFYISGGTNVTLTADTTHKQVTIEAIDTKYDAGTQALLEAGTDTTNCVWQPKIIHDYVGSVVGAADAMRFKGTLGTGGTVTTLPTTDVQVGDTYRVITAGTYASYVCEVGDLIIATATTPTWTVAQTNIDGAVTATTTTTNGYLAKFTGDKIVANGPQLGSDTTTFLRNDGTWAVPVDNKVELTAAGVLYTDRYIPFSSSATGTTGLNTNGALVLNLTLASPGKGVATLKVGDVYNYGEVYLYGSDSGAAALKYSSAGGSTHTFPSTGGTVLNTGTTSFTQTVSSGTKIGSIKINGTSTDIYAPATTTYTAFTGKPTADATPGWGGTVTISQISQATSGQVSGTDRTITIPSAVATTSAAGLMSATDKTKLDNLDNNFGNVSHGSVDIAIGANSATGSDTNATKLIACTASQNDEEVVIDAKINSGVPTFTTAENVASYVVHVEYIISTV